MIAASERAPIVFSLSGGNAHDSPEGEKLLDKFNKLSEQIYMIMDKAYEGENMRCKVAEKSLTPVVPPKETRKEKWEYDKERYKQRNKIERYFLRIKRFRRIFTRYDKTDVMYYNFIYFIIVIDTIISVNRL
jgi:transposase